MPTPLSCLGLPRATITLYAKLGGDYWDRTSRAISGGVTVRCITIDASSPLYGSAIWNRTKLAFAQINSLLPHLAALADLKLNLFSSHSEV